MTAWRSHGANIFAPWYLSNLTRAFSDLGGNDARRCISDAIATVETNKERWWEAEVYRIAGEIALKSPELNQTTAEAYFDRALAVARQQRAKSWELRAAMSMARLWRECQHMGNREFRNHCSGAPACVSGHDGACLQQPLTAC
jgi:predicted ATPase